MRLGYWKRTWLIQEIGEAVRLRVHFAGQSLPWDAFIAAVATYGKCFPRSSAPAGTARLDSIRKTRLGGEVFGLTDLISNFSQTFSVDPYDKIYAFLGMASDDSSDFVPATYDAALGEVHLNVLQFLAGSQIDRQLKQAEIVYVSSSVRRLLTRRTSVTLYVDNEPHIVVRRAEPYVYYTKGTKDSEGKEELVAQTGYHKNWSEWEYRKHSTPALYWLPSPPERLDTWTVSDQAATDLPSLTARGRLLGRILFIGPTVDEFLTSASETRKWKNVVIRTFAEGSTQKKMLALNERLHDIIASPEAASALASIAAFPFGESIGGFQQKQARLFIGSGGFLEVASPGFWVGDDVIQFWKSSAAAVAQITSKGSEKGTYSIKGRCSIVKAGYSLDWDTPLEISDFQGSNKSKAMLQMHVNTLVALTLDSLDLNRNSVDAKIPTLPTQPFSTHEPISRKSFNFFKLLF